MDAKEIKLLLDRLRDGIGQKAVALRCDCANLETVYITINDTDDVCVSEPDPAATGHIEFKDSPAWTAAYQELKEILAGREHLPTAAEREARRKSRGR
ncbi:MAG: hypothetical protein R3F19_28960 [Verrucomicrobiales bacterium]